MRACAYVRSYMCICVYVCVRVCACVGFLRRWPSSGCLAALLQLGAPLSPASEAELRLPMLIDSHVTREGDRMAPGVMCVSVQTYSPGRGDGDVGGQITYNPRKGR